ncbi:MAG: cytochrome-c oxidase, cbb3-type subunit III [Amylibacter sp.]|nr:cytochrome-c oxidase, cbb3-type subunit III [Amylibacter sp.]
MRKKIKKSDEDYPTTGHEWDGIREYDKPMPRWWLYTFYLCIIFAFGYMVAYPAIPLLKGATPGLLGFSTRAEVAKHIAEVNAQNAEIEAQLLSTPLEEISADADLVRFATAGGGAVFRTYCAQCHGAGAQGAKGYPNLQDDDWLWGGDLATIETTIQHGIRYEADEDTRFSEMPKFGDFLEKDEIAALAEYVLQVSGQEHDAALATIGQPLFEDNCVACHTEQATGDRELGAPNLADAIWLYGRERETITTTITNSRFGVMPAWQGRITEAQIKQVTFYVHQLGGGE